MCSQVWYQYRNQPVQPVKVLLEHRQLRVEECAELVDVDDLTHHGKSERLVPQEEVQEARNEVHALAVVELGVDHGVGEEDATQVLFCDALSLAKRPIDVALDLMLALLGQVKTRLIQVRLELASDELRVDLEELEPERLTFGGQAGLVRPKQGLFENRWCERLIEISTGQQNIPQRRITIYVLDRTARNQSQIAVQLESTHPLASLLQ